MYLKLGATMFENPFSPLFGGRPDVFFGRERIIQNFESALAVPGSDYRSLFITGTRGFGKTALLEQLSMRASKQKWDVIDVNAENALGSLFRHLARFDEVSTSTDPKVEVKILGSGGSVSGKSTQRTAHFTIDDLDTLLISACEKARRGVLVTIDEIQKVSLDDVSRICGAFQMASRKGHDVMLAVAGLPYSHEEIVQHDGCTYMRRAVHEELGLFTPEEAGKAFADSFARIKGLSVEDEALESFVSHSSGHPYMIQLLGYDAVSLANERDVSGQYSLTRQDAETCAQEALDAYERRALAPIVDALSAGELQYLHAAAQCLDDHLQAGTGDIARTLGKKTSQVSRPRERLVRSGILVSPSRGKVRFGIPFLRHYLSKDQAEQENNKLLDQWHV